MKKFIFFLATAFVSLPLLAQWDGTSAPWTQGNGTRNNPYQISTPNQLAFLSDMVSAGYEYSGQYFMLTNDISLGNQSWLPIGNNTHQFKGNFDGGNHLVDSLNVSSYSYKGLFGYISNDTIKNVKIIISTNGETTNGGVSGYAECVSFINCIVTCNISGQKTGGIVGWIGGSGMSKVQNCHVNGTSIQGTTYAGGFVGYATASLLILNSTVEIDSYISGDYSGGLVGLMNAYLEVRNCSFISGNVIGGLYSGGLIGCGTNVSVCGCDVYGDIATTSTTSGVSGGIAGRTSVASISECINHAKVRGSERIGGIIGYSTQPVNITRCANLDSLISTGGTRTTYIGGIIGDAAEGGTVSLCFNRGNIVADGSFSHSGDHSTSNYTYNPTNPDYRVFATGIGSKYYCVQGSHTYHRYYRGSNANPQYYYCTCHYTRTLPTSGLVISYCYNTGNIAVPSYIVYNGNASYGGISITSQEGSRVTGIGTGAESNVTNCYNTGHLSASGIYGISYSTTNSYYIEGCGATSGGQQRTSANMRSVSFPIILNVDSTVFVMDINNENNGYPIFHWETKGKIYTDMVQNLHSYNACIKGHYTGTADSCGFLYRQVGNDGSFTRVMLPIDGTEYSYALSSLSANTQYEYCFFKYWDGIAIHGDTLSFTTFPLYSVTVSSSNSSWGSVTGSGTFPHGDIDTIQAIAFANYRFLQWSDGNNNNPRYLTVTQDYNLTATFGPAIYNITLASNNNAWGSVSGGGSFNYNASATITATPAPHYHFVSWSDGNNNNPRTLIVTTDLNLTATFAPDSYTVTALPNNSTYGSATGSGTFIYGSIDTLTATAFEHYRFTGWNDGNTNNPRYLTVTQDSSFTAMFVYDAYTLSLSVNNPAWGSVNGGGMYEYGQQATATATAEEHYHFVSWDDGNTSNPRSLMITEDISLQAIFAPDNYTVTVQSSNPAWGSTTGSGSFAYGSIDTITATPIGSHVFAHWNDGTTSNPHHFTVLGDTTITAVFAPSQCTLTVTTNNTLWGTATGGGTFQYGQSAYCTAVANTGYHFVEWNDGNTDNPRVYIVEDNATLQAIFAPNQYTITLLTNDSTKGSVSGSGVYDYQQQIYIIAIPADGYDFAQWSDGNTSSYRQITVTQNMTYTAVFTDIIYNITVISSNPTYGYVTGGGQYARNSIATLTAVPNQGYHFEQWSDGNTQNPRIVTVTGDMTYYAQFAPDQYTITVNSDDISMGTATGSGVFGYGTQTTITATPMQHHRFLYWNDGITTNPRIITVSGDATYTAYFEPEEQYTISVVSGNPDRGTVSGGGTYYNGEQITIIASAFSGFTFDRWSDGNTESTRTITVAMNTTYTAYFAAPMYSVNVSCNENEGIVTGGGTYEQGTTVTVTATPKQGYRFMRWSNGVETEVYTFEIFNNINLVAFFDRTTGIINTYESFKVIVDGTLLSVNGADNLSVMITDVVGRILFASNKYHGETIDVQYAGVYFVKVGNWPAKKTIIIK